MRGPNPLLSLKDGHAWPSFFCFADLSGDRRNLSRSRSRDVVFTKFVGRVEHRETHQNP